MKIDVPNSVFCEIVSDAAAMLTLDEGNVASPYKDTLGFWTIGVGHFIGKDLNKMRLSARIINELLLEDMEIAWQVVCALFGTERVARWEVGRQLALLNLAFNLGATKLSQFTNTIAAIKADRWDDAAQHLAKSKWAEQVKSRSGRVIYMVKTGDVHESYRTRA